MQKIKCIIWDLDNTLWEGILLEDEKVRLRPEIKEIIHALDQRGILQSISSKNDYNTAYQKLLEFGLWDYFIYPQINWNAKSEAIGKIADSINIGLDTLAFVDDQMFELEEVRFTYPQVLCIHADKIYEILDWEIMNAGLITSDSKNRRQMYQNDIKRNDVEQEFTGTKEEFLKMLHMKFHVHTPKEEDLARVEELTIRTHQLNSTGYTYTYEELKKFTMQEEYEVLVVQLEDDFGNYGKIGLALVEKTKEIWVLKLLIMSCRVMSKGVGNVLLNCIINKARKCNVRLLAQFVPTDRNRVMYITYKFNGFYETETKTDITILEADLSYERKMPEYITFLDGSE